MDSLKSALFENPLYIYVALGLGLLALAAVWHERRSRKWLLAMLVPVLLASAVFTTERLVVTDRERIHRVASAIADAFGNGRLESIIPHLDDDFEALLAGVPVGRSDVEMLCRARMDQYGIRRVGLHNMQLEVQGDRAAMRVTSIVTFGSEGRQKTGLIWDIVWIKRGQAWRMWRVSEPRHGVELF